MKTYSAGKPPAPDWYEVKPVQPHGFHPVHPPRRMFRWWDGVQWSIPVPSTMTSGQAATAAAFKVSQSLIVQWTPVVIELGAPQ